jgi:hypothetical protein
MTRQAYRILLTLTNVRLGVWLPHPAVVAAAHRELELQQSGEHRRDRGRTALGLLLWYAWPLHGRWSNDTEKAGGREARLWAYVLKMRQTRKRMSGFFYHVMQPTLGLLWAEAVGHTSYRSTWVCVSDGGHYDNLGLVEALKRGAKNIVVLDASGDSVHTWFTLGGAFALARVDAGIDIELNPTDMCPKPLSPGEVKQSWAAGTFSPVPQWQGRTISRNWPWATSGCASWAGHRPPHGMSRPTPRSTRISLRRQRFSSCTTERSLMPTASWA